MSSSELETYGNLHEMDSPSLSVMLCGWMNPYISRLDTRPNFTHIVVRDTHIPLLLVEDAQWHLQFNPSQFGQTLPIPLTVCLPCFLKMI